MDWSDDFDNIMNALNEDKRGRRKRRKYMDSLSVENFEEFQAVSDADDKSGQDMDMCGCSHRRWTHGHSRFTDGDGCARCGCDAFSYVEPEVDTPDDDGDEEMDTPWFVRTVPIALSVLFVGVLTFMGFMISRGAVTPVLMMLPMVLMMLFMGGGIMLTRTPKSKSKPEMVELEPVTKAAYGRFSTVSDHVTATPDGSLPYIPAPDGEKEADRRKEAHAADKPVSARNLTNDWTLAKGRLEALAQTFMDFENDPLSYYFTRPLLRDVSEHDTAEFYRLWNEAQRLDTERMPAKEYRVDTFIDAVAAAERAWDVADANAKRKAEQHFTIKGKHLDDKQVRDLKTARNALAIVLDAAATASEQAAAWDRMQKILKRLDLAVSEDQTRRIRSVALTRGDVMAELEAPKMSAEAAMFAPKDSSSELFADVVFDERKGETA